jgi:hypothetical protein
MIDTLRNTIHRTTVIIDTVKTSSASSLDLINKVDTFYNNAWLKLVFTVTILGLVLPYFIAQAQKKELKLREQELQNNIDKNKNELIESIRETERTLTEKIKGDFDKQLEVMKADIEKHRVELDKLYEQKYETSTQELKNDFDKIGKVNLSQIYFCLRYAYEAIIKKEPINAKSALSTVRDLIYKVSVHELDKFLADRQTTFIFLLEKIHKIDKDGIMKDVGTIEAYYKEFHSPLTYGKGDEGGYPYLFQGIPE